MTLRAIIARLRAVFAGAGITTAASTITADKAQLGERARRLLDDPVLQLAFARLDEDLMATWRSSKLADREQREEAYRLHWAIEGARSKLRGMAGTARLVAELQRREEEQRRQAGDE